MEDRGNRTKKPQTNGNLPQSQRYGLAPTIQKPSTMKKFSVLFFFLLVSVWGYSQTTVTLEDQCNCEVLSGTDVTAAGATTPTGADLGDIYVNTNTGTIYFWDGDSWEFTAVDTNTTNSAFSVVGTDLVLTDSEGNTVSVPLAEKAKPYYRKTYATAFEEFMPEPEIEIITPIRDLKISREDEVDYLRKAGVEMNWSKVEYSINKGIWGTSVGGKETLSSSDELPPEAYPTPMEKSGSETVSIGFEQGEPVSLNEQLLEPLMVIRELEKLAAPWGVGRDVHVGDTIIGIKGRVGFEAAASRIMIDAHLALEKHVLSRWQLHWKEQIGQWYGMFVHEAQYLEPVMRDLESFLESSQKNVTGKVRLRLRPYSFSVTGVESPFDLMNASFASYGEMNKAWTAEEVDGFTRIMGNQQRIWYAVNGTDGQNQE